jgi:hypothetical protein
MIQARCLGFNHRGRMIRKQTKAPPPRRGLFHSSARETGGRSPRPCHDAAVLGSVVPEQQQTRKQLKTRRAAPRETAHRGTGHNRPSTPRPAVCGPKGAAACSHGWSEAQPVETVAHTNPHPINLTSPRKGRRTEPIQHQRPQTLPGPRSGPTMVASGAAAGHRCLNALTPVKRADETHTHAITPPPSAASRPPKERKPGWHASVLGSMSFAGHAARPCSRGREHATRHRGRAHGRRVTRQGSPHSGHLSTDNP